MDGSDSDTVTTCQVLARTRISRTCSCDAWLYILEANMRWRLLLTARYLGLTVYLFKLLFVDNLMKNVLTTELLVY